MISWLTALPLKFKIWGISLGVALLSIGSLWAAWRLAANRAKSADARAKALAKARESEQAIRNRQDALRLKQQRLREALRTKQERDYFEQGYGP